MQPCAGASGEIAAWEQGRQALAATMLYRLHGSYKQGFQGGHLQGDAKAGAPLQVPRVCSAALPMVRSARAGGSRGPSWLRTGQRTGRSRSNAANAPPAWHPPAEVVHRQLFHVPIVWNADLSHPNCFVDMKFSMSLQRALSPRVAAGPTTRAASATLLAYRSCAAPARSVQHVKPRSMSITATSRGVLL